RVAGSMDTTISDLAKFVAALVRGDGLSAATRAEMVKPSLHIGTAHQFPNFAPNLPKDQQRPDLAAGLGAKLGNWWAVPMCREGLTISARAAAERPSPRTSAATNFARSLIVVSIEPATRTLERSSCSCGSPLSFHPSARFGRKSGRHCRLVRVMPSRAKMVSVSFLTSRPSPLVVAPCSMVNCSKLKPSPE